MSYGPGDNAFVIDRKSAEGGDKVQIFAEKVKAQLDKIYEQLNEDIRPASENERGLIRIASQHDVDLGLADASAITPLTLRNSQLAADVSDAKTQAGTNAASIGTLGGEVAAVRSTAMSAASVAQQALDAAQSGGGSGGAGASAVPTAETFKAMPEVGIYPSPDYPSVNIRAIKLPDGGTWAYCGRLDYMWGNADAENPASASLCGVAAGGTIVWRQTTQNHGGQMRSHQLYGFVWKIS